MSSPSPNSHVIHVPLPVPSHPNASPPPALNEKEQTEYDLVLAHFSKPEYILPDVQSGKGALLEEERMWLSYECILRYIRATKHDVPESIKRLEGTLKWRRDFGVYTTITADHVEPEASTGKEFLFGYDTCGRPALYMCPSKQNTEEGPRQIEFVVWMLERAIDLMGPGVETLALMIDYADKAKNPSLSTAQKVLNILQTHYPERLGAALIAHLPWLLQAFYKLINPFIDPVTRMKMVFNPVRDDDGLWRSRDKGQTNEKGTRKPGEPDPKVFELDQLVQEGWEGSQNFVYAHTVYWPALVEVCETRRADMIRVWRELGGVVGIKEWDVKIGVRDGRFLEEKTTVFDGTGQAI
ncbi:CRAL TRIO domain-containing protein [Phlebopus sp. FC_14]|nr:CRAL TRIO domain-containing protein [Phlebopus sp. FC_14]